MRRANISINKGIAQGIIVGDIYSPNDNFASFTLRLRDSEISEENGKKNYHYVVFNAYGDVAKKIKGSCKANTVVNVEYYISSTRRKNKDGVFDVVDTRTVSDIVVGEEVFFPNRTKIPYINFGIISGEFVNIKQTPEDENKAIMTIRTSAIINGNAVYYYAGVLAIGEIWGEIEEKYKSGDEICVEYKLSTDKSERDRRKTTRYEATRIA